MSARRVKTPVAGPCYTPLPCAPLKALAVTNLVVTSAAAASHVVGADTTMVRLLAKGGAIYIAADATADATSQELNPLGGSGTYDTRGVDPGSTISMRAVTGSVDVQVVEF